MSEPLLELDCVSKSFGECEVFSALSFSIDSHGVFAILGPSGSGKTTILRIIAGLIAPSSGRVLFQGRPIDGPDPERVLIFQQYALFPWATARDNLMFGLRLSSNRRKAPLTTPKEKANELLHQIGLAEFGGHYPGTLSGGMQQRIAMARAMALSPSLLLMDEPFGALDSLTKLSMREFLRSELATGDRSAILVTHDIEDAISLAHTTLVLSTNPPQVVTRDAIGPHPEGKGFEERSRSALREAISAALGITDDHNAMNRR
jgi:NitT/TauT family transport system ATP-binding protein